MRYTRFVTTLIASLAVMFVLSLEAGPVSRPFLIEREQLRYLADDGRRDGIDHARHDGRMFVDQRKNLAMTGGLVALLLAGFFLARTETLAGASSSSRAKPTRSTR